MFIVQGDRNRFHLEYHTLKFKESHRRNRLSRDLMKITSPALFRKLWKNYTIYARCSKK